MSSKELKTEYNSASPAVCCPSEIFTILLVVCLLAGYSLCCCVVFKDQGPDHLPHQQYVLLLVCVRSQYEAKNRREDVLYVVSSHYFSSCTQQWSIF